MAKFNADTEDRIANAINYTKTNPGVKLSVVAYKFVVPMTSFIDASMDALLATLVVATIRL